MMKSTLLVLLTFFTLINQNIAQALSAKEILTNSQKYHDPEGLLLKEKIQLSLNEPRPTGGDRRSTITIDLFEEFFSIKRKSEKHEIYMETAKGEFSSTFDGSKEISQEAIKSNKITAERLNLLKNYYEYLWLLPIKLNDPGTQIDESVFKKDFFGKTGWQIKVTYSPEVGKDTWYFYFDPITYAMIGYRFYHDESKNDGEYILLEGEVSGNGIRIPATRKWYKHQKDEYLGQDILEKITVISR